MQTLLCFILFLLLLLVRWEAVGRLQVKERCGWNNNFPFICKQLIIYLCIWLKNKLSKTSLNLKAGIKDFDKQKVWVFITLKYFLGFFLLGKWFISSCEASTQSCWLSILSDNTNIPLFLEVSFMPLQFYKDLNWYLFLPSGRNCNRNLGKKK